MGSKRPTLTYRRLRAPQADGEVMIDPEWEACLRHPYLNSELCNGLEFSLLGRSYQDLRSSMRNDAVRLATEYTAEYLSADYVAKKLPVDVSGTKIVMSGHQPRLFHPGVWAKNFAVARIAEHVDGLAIHVIIDNDTMRQHALRLPTGTKSNPRQVSEPFDSYSDPLPFEVREVMDCEVLESFPSRVLPRLQNFVKEPLISEIWPQVLRAAERGKPLGHAFAEARHMREFAWGLRTLEVPLSQLCETDTFRWFAFSMLVKGPALTASYNQRLSEYRQLHKLRSAAQPLPDLRSADGWTESPFWMWHKRKDFLKPKSNNEATPAVRQALWWKRVGDDLLIRREHDTDSWTLSNALNTPEAAFKEFQHLCDHSVSVRPRALTNTIFLRLFASDAFVHGIGGAKYDQVTDLIMHDIFRTDDLFSPPKFIALSQTIRLPIDTDLITQKDCAKQRQRLRQMYFHPERYLVNDSNSNPQVSCIAEKKAKLVSQIPKRGERKQRHIEIADCNAMLREFLQKNTDKQREILRQMESAQRASALLGSREWSFCLFPDEHLRTHLLDLGGTSL